jgi:cellulose biosynthesis protein BcsQ
MSIIKLVIGDSNPSYGISLSQYLQDEYGQAFEILHFTQAQLLEEYLREHGDADLLLLDEDFDYPAEAIGKSAAVLFFTGKKNIGIEKNQIYKYQKADAIAKQLMMALDKDTGKSIHLAQNNKKTKVVVAYSPEGGAGKTTIAHRLAHQYALNFKKPLYLSFESFSSLSMFEGSGASRGAIYLLHLLKNKASNVQLKLNGLKCSEADTQIHYLPREDNALEYKDLKKEDMELLLEFLKSQCDYDAILVDFDSSLSDGLLGAMRQCDTFLAVVGDDSGAQGKHRMFYDSIPKLNEVLGIRLEDKLVFVFNKGCRPHELQNTISIGKLKLAAVPYIEQNETLYGGHLKELYQLLEKDEDE